MRHHKSFSLVAVAAFALFGASVAAATTSITVQNGGITINSTNTSTTGDLENPWLIDESMTGTGTLKFLQANPDEICGPLGCGNPAGTGHANGKWFQKSVTNDTDTTWTSFEMELQVILGTPSGQGDGLSFAQGADTLPTFFSNIFTEYTRDDVRDALNFHGGQVLPGQTVTFNFVITDRNRENPFYLLQSPNGENARVAEPATLALLGSGLVLLGLFARRRLA